VVIGARLPHFWLKPAGDDAAPPLSSLELAPLIARRDRKPKHLLLLIDLSLKLGRRLAALREKRFGPLELVRVGTAPRNGGTVDYRLSGEIEGFRPERGALMIRPDNIVAWIW
jgi:hypothetical protein